MDIGPRRRVLHAHLGLQTVGVPEEEAEDGAEVGDEAVAGATGDQSRPDDVECLPRRGLEAWMIDAAAWSEASPHSEQPGEYRTPRYSRILAPPQ